MAAPYCAQSMNDALSYQTPTAMACDNISHQYFSRYLLQMAMSVFKWTMPATWHKPFVIGCIYEQGRAAVFRSPRFGVVALDCTMGGERDLYYQPTRALINNPLLDGLELRIHQQCELLYMTPDYAGVTDLIGDYANRLALCLSAGQCNVINSKLAYIMAAGNKAAAESYKKMYDEIQAGKPAVVIDKTLLNDNGDAAWQTFSQNLAQNFIAPDILATMRAITEEFCSRVGIPNTDTSKRERKNTDEVHANDVETRSLASIWLESLQEQVKRCIKMFPELEGQLSVDWRWKDEEVMANVPDNND